MSFRRSLTTDKTFMFIPSFKSLNSADITVNRLEVLHGAAEVTCIVAKQIDIPARSTITTRMYLIPEHAGELYISGVRVGEVI